ncbi:MAG: phosphopantetheine-binding protein [Mycobacterium sp.]
MERLYAELAEGRAARLDEIRAHVAARPVIETIISAVEATLGMPAAEVTPDSRFIDLGGDSLSGLTFTDVLTDVFGVEVPSNVVLNPTGDLERIAAFISSALEGDSSALPTHAAVHSDSRVVRADELTLDRFISADILREAPKLSRVTAPFRSVLVTGANGFLGRFLCLEWLERVATHGGTVIAIARGRDAGEARRRITDAYASDIDLLRRFEALADDHLEVVAGDLGAPAALVRKYLADFAELELMPDVSGPTG